MPLNILTQGQEGETTLIFSKKTVITDAQIKSLGASPIEIIPSPGLGKQIFVQGAVYNLNTMAGAYAGTGNFELVISTEDQAIEFTNYVRLDKNASTFTAHVSPLVQTIDGFGNQQFVSSGSIQNLGVVLAGYYPEALTGGNAANTLEVTVFYSIIDS